MSPAASLPEAFADLLRVLARRYGIGTDVPVRRLTGGFANDVFRLDLDPAPVVLHLKSPPANGASIDWEHRLLADLYSRLPEALPPLPALDGSTWFWHRDRPAWLVAWAPGHPAGPRDRKAVAVVLARLHAASLKAVPRPGHDRLLSLPLPPVGQFPAAFTPWLPILTAARAELTAFIEELTIRRKPTSGLTHNDIFEGNVLIDGGRVSALLDWEEATIDWLAWDVAGTLWPFCADGDRLDPVAVEEFLTAYRTAGGPLPSDEDELIKPLVRARRILEVLRAPTDRQPRWSLQLANLRAYQALG